MTRLLAIRRLLRLPWWCASACALAVLTLSPIYAQSHGPPFADYPSTSAPINTSLATAATESIPTFRVPIGRQVDESPLFASPPMAGAETHRSAPPVNLRTAALPEFGAPPISAPPVGGPWTQPMPVLPDGPVTFRPPAQPIHRTSPVEAPMTDRAVTSGPPIPGPPIPGPPIPGPPVGESIESYGEPADCGHSGGNSPFDPSVFCPDPRYDGLAYEPRREIGPYVDRWHQCSQRPLIELGRGVYRDGPVPRSYSFLGSKNLITPGFTLFGDYRTAIASNDNGKGNANGVWAHRLNLDFDLRITSTERFHAFWGPLDEDGRFTRAVFNTDGDDDIKFFEEFDDDFDTVFFEGDLGYLWGGMTDQWAPFDLPFVVGKFPLLFQNGIWINDALEGFAFTIPAKNSRLLDWSNYEVTCFIGFDDVDSPAFAGNDNAANVYGLNAFIEAYGGYTEIGYAFLDDSTGQGLGYHNLSMSHTRRFFECISNSVRVILNMGQDPVEGPQTADGQLILIENSLVSSNPNYFVPYFNLFAGFDRPQNVAQAAGGVLLNTGINFETDALTGFPRLTDTAQDAWGGAFGFNLLGPSYSWQWVLEAAMVQAVGDSVNGDEYAVGSRVQVPINYAWLVRFDAMYGMREKGDDTSGFRAEMRWKF